MNTEKKDDFRRAILFFYKHNLLISNIFHNFAESFCISYVEIQKIGSFWFFFCKILFNSFFGVYRAANILALASSTSELLMERRYICVVISE